MELLSLIASSKNKLSIISSVYQLSIDRPQMHSSGRFWVSGVLHSFLPQKGRQFICVDFCGILSTWNSTWHIVNMIYEFVIIKWPFKFTFVFNWRIIALHYCVGFCHVLTRVSHRYTYDPSLLNLAPTFYSFIPL